MWTCHRWGAAGFTSASPVGNPSPLSPLAELWKISREGKDWRDKGSSISGRSVQPIRPQTDTDCLFSSRPQFLILRIKGDRHTAFLCRFLLEIQPHPHVTLSSYKILYNFAVISQVLYSVLMSADKFASPVGLFMSGAQECIFGKDSMRENAIFVCLFVCFNGLHFSEWF